MVCRLVCSLASQLAAAMLWIALMADRLHALRWSAAYISRIAWRNIPVVSFVV
jgi:hypothetical protein